MCYIGIKALKFDYMIEDNVVTSVIVNEIGEVSVEQVSKDTSLQAFGGKTDVGICDVLGLLSSRLPNVSRKQASRLKTDYGVDVNDVVAFCRLTRGLRADDNLWIRFDNDYPVYNNMKLFMFDGIVDFNEEVS